VVGELIRQGRAWVPVAKAAVLFALSMPIFLDFVVALFGSDIVRVAVSTGALAAIGCASVLTLRALVAQARYFLGQRPDPPLWPLKSISAVLTAVAAGLAASAGGHGVAMCAVFAAFAAAGYMLFYGRDVRPRRVTIAAAEGVDVASVTAQLKQAYGRLRGIDSAARAIAVPEFGAQLARITDIGRQILAEIERDPRDATRARRFLNIYLDSAERVTTEYARTHRHIVNRPLEDNFKQLLVDMESTFSDQYKKLLENDVDSLDVEINVLNERLKREGVG